MSGLLAGAVLLATLTLDDARGLAQQNIEVRVAALRVRQAEEQRRIARAAVLPHVVVRTELGGLWNGPQRYTSTFPLSDASGRESYERQSVDVPAYGHGVFSAAIGISQLLYDGGRFWNEISRTRALADAERGRLAEQRLAVTLETDRLYLDAWRATRVSEALDQAIEHAKDQRKRAEARYAYGRGHRRDMIDAELNQANDELARARQDVRIANAKSALRAWLLLPDDRFAVTSSPAPDGAVPILGSLLTQARARRPLLSALAREREAAEQQVTISRSPYFPRVTLEGSYQRQGTSANPYFTDPAKQNALQGGVVLTWNVFDGFATAAAVASAKLSVEQSKLEITRAERQIEAEISQAFAFQTASWNAHAIAERSRGLANEDLKLAEERFTAGTGSTVEIREAQVKWLQAQLNFIDAEIDVRMARATLTRVVGAGP